jgi:hypothetical protein
LPYLSDNREDHGHCISYVHALTRIWNITLTSLSSSHARLAARRSQELAEHIAGGFLDIHEDLKEVRIWRVCRFEISAHRQTPYYI